MKVAIALGLTRLFYSRALGAAAALSAGAVAVASKNAFLQLSTIWRPAFVLRLLHQALISEYPLLLPLPVSFTDPLGVTPLCMDVA